MAPDDQTTIPQDEQTTGFVVVRWLIMALPEDLADALDRYATSLGPEATPAEAARIVLQEVLLKRTPLRTLAMSPIGDHPPTHTTAPQGT
jgi:hypothetical protein